MIEPTFINTSYKTYNEMTIAERQYRTIKTKFKKVIRSNHPVRNTYFAGEICIMRGCSFPIFSNDQGNSVDIFPVIYID